MILEKKNLIMKLMKTIYILQDIKENDHFYLIKLLYFIKIIPNVKPTLI